MATPLVTGVAVATAALASKYGIRAWQALKARPPIALMREFYEGGFEPSMTRREAARILGLSKKEMNKYVHALKMCRRRTCLLMPQHNQFIFLNMERATMDQVKEAYRRVMIASHPDVGGSHYLSSKVNEAKDMMLGKTKGSGSAF